MLQSLTLMSLKPAKNQVLIFCLLVIAGCAISLHAQSGRKQPKPPQAAPVPTPTPEPTPEPKAQQKEPELGFSIASDRFTSYESYPVTYYDAAMVGCADRLRSRTSARVDIARDSVSRSDAIKKAKNETITYVVLMKLVLDESARSYNDLEVDFTVFAPKTAKVVIFGRSYLNVNRAGPITTGPTSRGSTSALYREQLIKRAGEDAGERILKALNLGNVPIIR
jgi:hypothetical protein